jgi:TM2 domain-containing membrane protein YozV
MAICPYCRTEIDPASTNRLYCNACGTPHHQDCFVENRGCSVFGCKQAPADEPKLQVPPQQAGLTAQPAQGVFGQHANGPAAAPARPPQSYGTVPAAPIPNPGAGSPPPGYAPGQYVPPPPGVGAAQPAYGYGQQPPYAPPPGYAQQPPAYAPPPYAQQPVYPQQAPPVFYAQPAPPNYQAPKSRIAYILLGVFLGGLGIHNFYAGYTNKGLAQLLISVLTCGYGAIVSWIWAIIEICTVDKDSRNIYFN